ncbi:EYxxD motif small membrane protein [Halalkalibacter alkalisediminis]|uniref:EYxxD motif small membrane protein n=1 Tax=Halalkalibacter alkalisediminis TaxID=935616 RepID=A0ABV6NE37_9BACI
MFNIQEYATDSLFIYIMVIGCIVALIYFFMKKKRVK